MEALFKLIEQVGMSQGIAAPQDLRVCAWFPAREWLPGGAYHFLCSNVRSHLFDAATFQNYACLQCCLQRTTNK